MQLRFDEPYGQVYGEPPMPGACFEQGGRYFRRDGSLIGDPPKVDEPQRRTATDDYRAMTTERLKQIALVYGVEWTSRADVIRQLEGRE